MEQIEGGLKRQEPNLNLKEIGKYRNIQHDVSLFKRLTEVHLVSGFRFVTPQLCNTASCRRITAAL